jgi:cell division protein FtsB
VQAINKIKKWLEDIMPMTFANFVVLLVIVYLAFIVSKTVWENYQSNQQIASQQQELTVLDADLDYMQNEIVYLNSNSFKEKQARSKLAYVAPGETAVSVPLDEIETVADTKGKETSGGTDTSIANYYLWVDYFTN